MPPWPCRPPCGLHRGGAAHPGAGTAHRVGLNAGSGGPHQLQRSAHDYSAVGQTTHLRRAWSNWPHGDCPPDSRDPTAGRGPGTGQRPGPIPVKGLTEPVEVFELVWGHGGYAALPGAALQGLTRFVWRQREIDTLHQALDQAGTGHGQVVALVVRLGWGNHAWSMNLRTRTTPLAWARAREPLGVLPARPHPISPCRAAQALLPPGGSR